MQMVKVVGPAGAYDVPLHAAPLSTRFLQGAGLAVALTLLRVLPALSAGRLTPGLSIIAVVGVSLGGGVGGLVYYATDGWRVRGGMRRTFANVGSLLAYCFATLGALAVLATLFHLW